MNTDRPGASHLPPCQLDALALPCPSHPTCNPSPTSSFRRAWVKPIKASGLVPLHPPGLPIIYSSSALRVTSLLRSTTCRGSHFTQGKSQSTSGGCPVAPFYLPVLVPLRLTPCCALDPADKVPPQCLLTCPLPGTLPPAAHSHAFSRYVSAQGSPAQQSPALPWAFYSSSSLYCFPSHLSSDYNKLLYLVIVSLLTIEKKVWA